MSKQTKYEVLREFVSDINDLLMKINENTAAKTDYHKLKEMFMMVNVEESAIDNIYLKCGFEDHADFLTQRNSPLFMQKGNVSCSVSKINGLCEAVVEFLTCEIAKDLNKC